MSASFGPFMFDAKTGALSRDGKAITVGTRGAALLSVLIEADGAAVAKEALVEAGWPSTLVEEGNLSVQIANLRKVMGLRPDGLDWIATVPRVGYRLLKAVAPTAGMTSAPVIPSLAVLPFTNLSGDPEQEYFADGVVEDIITALSRFKSFAVIARNSSFVYKGRAVDVRQVAKELGVRYVLEGSVRRSGDKLRISTQLVDGNTGAHLWADHFDGDLKDVFEFQDTITSQVAAVVGPGIQTAEADVARRERPNSVAAYDLYLRSVSMDRSFNEAANREGIALVRAALELDPNDARLLSHAGHLYHRRVRAGWPPASADDAAECAGYVERALLRGSGDARVLALCAGSMIHAMKDYDRGLETARRAVAMNPNEPEALSVAGVANLHCGDIDDALDYLERGLRLSPYGETASWLLTGLAHVHAVRGEYEQAISYAERSLAARAGHDATYWMLIAANVHLGRMDQARRYLTTYLKLEPHTTIAVIRAGQPDKNPSRIEPILKGLGLAGLPES
jgi:TolB-like protein/tetratricopeptide (TPR) repeat protein